MKNLWITFTLMLVGCASTGHVIKLGPDTYQLVGAAAPIRGGGFAAQQAVVDEANQYCATSSREIVVTNSNIQGPYAQVTFRCLTAGDPDLERPTYRAPPAAVIEDRR